MYSQLAEEEQQHDVVPPEARTMLMSNAEALHSLYGEISTERDGDLTHQCIQTNLADVICGGSPEIGSPSSSLILLILFLLLYFRQSQ